ncbi:MAG TPA: hypothetical protein VG650_08760 [Mycobacteriales bacterium]|nr:hypothetical protein [Mycobacteriales bacterium]
MRRVAAFIASLVVSCLIIAIGVGRGAPSAAVASTTSPFTAYIDVGDNTGLAALGQRIGTPISYAYDYFDDRSWANIDDTWNMNNWAGTGYRMIWGVPMLPLSGATLSIGATGAYDQYYVTVAKDLVAHGMGNSILRLGWEFNQKSYPWYAAGQAPAFVAYWRHIVTAMRSVSGAAFTFEWNPSLGDNGGGDAAMGNFTSYYPGDAYVDVVALDVYDIAWNNYPGEPAQFSSFETRTWGLNWLASFASQHAKSLAIAEFGLGWGGSAGNGQPYSGSGTVCGGDNPRFVHDMAAWMKQHNAVTSGYWDNSFSSIDNGQNPLTASEIAADFGSGATLTPSTSPTQTSTAPTTTKHKRSHLRQAGLTLGRVVASANGITLSGRLVPAHSGIKVRVETAQSAHAARWASRGQAATSANGRFHTVVANPAHARYVRVVAKVGRHTRSSHPVMVG